MEERENSAKAINTESPSKSIVAKRKKEHFELLPKDILFYLLRFLSIKEIFHFIRANPLSYRRITSDRSLLNRIINNKIAQMFEDKQINENVDGHTHLEYLAMFCQDSDSFNAFLTANKPFTFRRAVRLAALHGNLTTTSEIQHFFITHPDLKDSSLLMAASNGQEDIAAFYLDKLNSKTSGLKAHKIYSALQIAAMNGHNKIIDVVMDIFANGNLYTNYFQGSNVLFYAIACGQTKTIEYLLKLDEDLNKRIVLNLNNAEKEKSILKMGKYVASYNKRKVNLNRLHTLIDPVGNPLPIELAVMADQHQSIRALANLGVNINEYPNADGLTLLHFAAQKNTNLTCFFEIILQSELYYDVQIVSNKWRPIHVAVASGNFEFVKQYIEAGCPFTFDAIRERIDAEGLADCKNYENNTPIESLICLMNQKQGNMLYDQAMLDALLFCAIRVANKKPQHTSDNQDVLEELVSSVPQRPENNGIVSLLLENGANPNAKDHYNRLPIHLAIKCDNPELIENLIEFGADTTLDIFYHQPLHYAAYLKATKAFTALIKNCKVDILQRSEHGNTVLHVLSSAQKHNDTILWMLRYLLSKNRIDINIENYSGTTPLHFAASKGTVQTIKMLLENGANIEARNKFEQTPLYLATQNKNPSPVFQEIINAGGDLHAKINRHVYNPIIPFAIEEGISIIDVAVKMVFSYNKTWLSYLHVLDKKIFAKLEALIEENKKRPKNKNAPKFESTYETLHSIVYDKDNHRCLANTGDKARYAHAALKAKLLELMVSPEIQHMDVRKFFMGLLGVVIAVLTTAATLGIAWGVIHNKAKLGCKSFQHTFFNTREGHQLYELHNTLVGCMG